MASSPRTQLESWLKGIDVRADSVLDVGSGQKGIKGRTKSFEVNELIGLDLDKPHKGEKQDIVCDLNYPIEFI
uniref:Putative methyltransferase n=1 Tax=viral metagenome TaxID=1070528 RepID=A0A6M3M7S6_9ZZZZ